MTKSRTIKTYLRRATANAPTVTSVLFVEPALGMEKPPQGPVDSRSSSKPRLVGYSRTKWAEAAAVSRQAERRFLREGIVCVLLVEECRLNRVRVVKAESS